MASWNSWTRTLLIVAVRPLGMVLRSDVQGMNRRYRLLEEKVLYTREATHMHQASGPIA